MANTIYPKAKEAFLANTISWTGDTIKALLIDTGAYTPNFSTDQYKSDIPSGAIIAVSATLGSKTCTLGVADASDPFFTAVTGPTCEAVVLIKDTGTSSTSPLIVFLDTGSGVPITPNGGDITIQWDNGTYKIFSL